MIDIDWRQVFSQIALYFGAGLIAVVCGFPLLWMVLTSVRPDRDILSPAPKFWSFEYHWEHYRNLYNLTDFHIYFFNSITIAGTATLLTILVATLAAYGIHPVPVRRPGDHRGRDAVHLHVRARSSSSFRSTSSCAPPGS